MKRVDFLKKTTRVYLYLHNTINRILRWERHYSGQSCKLEVVHRAIAMLDKADLIVVTRTTAYIHTYIYMYHHYPKIPRVTRNAPSVLSISQAW